MHTQLLNAVAALSGIAAGFCRAVLPRLRVSQGWPYANCWIITGSQQACMAVCVLSTYHVHILWLHGLK